MEVFLNERSLHSQFGDVSAFTEALIGVNHTLKTLTDIKCDKRVFLHFDFYASQVIGTRGFSYCLNAVSEKSVRFQFKLLLRTLDSAFWQAERVHRNVEYLWNGFNVESSSIAELCERILHERKGCLISFPSFKFPPEEEVVVEIDRCNSAQLTSVRTSAELKKWCASLNIGFPEFDPALGRSPLDEETVLHDRRRFSKTPYLNQGRAVYQEYRTSWYFCVDNFHYYGAHLEVFDASGSHIGEASLDGVLDRSKTDKTKDLST